MMYQMLKIPYKVCVDVFFAFFFVCFKGVEWLYVMKIKKLTTELVSNF